MEDRQRYRWLKFVAAMQTDVVAASRWATMHWFVLGSQQENQASAAQSGLCSQLGTAQHVYTQEHKGRTASPL